jgi:hypothetical protein
MNVTLSKTEMNVICDALWDAALVHDQNDDVEKAKECDKLAERLARQFRGGK